MVWFLDESREINRMGKEEDRVRFVLGLLAARFERKSWHVLVHLIRVFVGKTLKGCFVPIRKDVACVSNELVGAEVALCACKFAIGV